MATDTQVWADTARPRFIEIVGPYKKWGGDNADAFYCFAPVDPARTYRVRVRRGDAVYLSLTVYGGPDDGRYSERIVGSLNDRQAPPDPDGVIDMVLSPDDPGDGTPWIRLDPDAVAVITRDYLADPVHDVRAVWEISADDPPTTYREDDAELARRFRAALTWVRDQAAMVPLAMGEPNQVDPPYPVPTTTFGWAAGDAAYAMGSYLLDDDQALVLRGRSPDCAFWNLCLWNPFLHTYNYDYERVTINGAQVRYEADGSWEIVDRPHAIPGIRTGSRRPGTTRAGSGSAGSCPSARPTAIDAEVVSRPVPAMSAPVRPPPIVLDDLARPRFSDEARSILDMMSEAGAATSLEPDALMGAAVAETGLDDFGPDDFVPRLDVLCRSLREEARLNDAGVLAQSVLVTGLLRNRLLLEDLVRSTSRDPGRAGREAHRHLRAAPHRHHASAQPDVLGPRAPVPALLGEHGAGPGRAGAPGGGRPGPQAGTNGAWPCPFSTWPCPSSSACTR